MKPLPCSLLTPFWTSTLVLGASLTAVDALDLRILPLVDEDPLTSHELVWESTPGAYYSLQQSPDLANWETFTGYLAQAAGTEQHQPILVSAGARFFQVREVDVAQTITWTIGKASSSIDGGASTGPVMFSWTFDRPVEHGVYLDGTPWVVWQEGLQLIAVSPAKKIETVPAYNGAILTNAIVDATSINLKVDRLPLDQRMGDLSGTGAPWGGGADVWDGQPTALAAGDCIVTGRGRRNDRSANRKMIFTAIGVCNIVTRNMTGHYRPPIRMPAELRATLVTPTEVDVSTLPPFALSQPRNWNGSPVTLDLLHAVGTADADDLLNGPIANCGLLSYVWYEPGNGMLNHNLSGTDDAGYQRNVAQRFATCLYTAFDPSVDAAKRQRSLNKFIQTGLDYFYMHCLGYAIWNGGGGHCDGLEGAITLAGALLGDPLMTDAMKYQRFPGDAVGRPGVVVDMLGGYQGSFSRTEGCYLVQAAGWQSGDFIQRSFGTGAATLEETVFRIDMARADMVLNNDTVPYTGITQISNTSAITISSSFAWPMYTQNKSTEASRSYRYLPGAALRLGNDSTIRRVVAFKATSGTDWTEAAWNAAAGKGGLILVYPALTPDELLALSGAGTLATGVTTRDEAHDIVLWESWPADALNKVLKNFYNTPIQDYIDIKLCGNFTWLPYYHLLQDPGAPGKLLYEESTSYAQVRKFVRMQRDFGTAFWSQFVAGANVPDSPTIQALIRHFILDDQMASEYCKAFGASDAMWTDSP